MLYLWLVYALTCESKFQQNDIIMPVYQPNLFGTTPIKIRRAPKTTVWTQPWENNKYLIWVTFITLSVIFPFHQQLLTCWCVECVCAPLHIRTVLMCADVLPFRFHQTLGTLGGGKLESAPMVLYYSVRVRIRTRYHWNRDKEWKQWTGKRKGEEATCRVLQLHIISHPLVSWFSRGIDTGIPGRPNNSRGLIWRALPRTFDQRI